MAELAEQARQLPTRVRIVLGLLFLAAVINYVDRGSLSMATASKAFKTQIPLSPEATGWLLSGFFWTYALCQLGTGWLVDRYSVNRIFGIGFALWSLATILAAFVHNGEQLFVLRMLLGVGEAVTFPCFAKIISASFPAEKRGVPNAVIDAGTKIGPALGVFLGAVLIKSYDWRVMFFVLGAASLVWLLPWLIWGPRSGDRTKPTQAAEAGPGFWQILCNRQALGTFLGAGSYTYAYFFLLTWLPKYLVDIRGFSMDDLKTQGSALFLVSAAAALVAGWLSDRWIKRGMSTTKARKIMVVGGLLLSMAALPAALAKDVSSTVAWLAVAYIAFGIFASNLWAISQTLAGEAAAGKWAGLQNCLGGLTGIAAPIITGIIVQHTGSYNLAFTFAACLAAIGAASYLLIVGKIEPIDWSAGREDHRA